MIQRCWTLQRNYRINVIPEKQLSPGINVIINAHAESKRQSALSRGGGDIYSGGGDRCYNNTGERRSGNCLAAVRQTQTPSRPRTEKFEKHPSTLFCGWLLPSKIRYGGGHGKVDVDPNFFSAPLRTLSIDGIIISLRLGSAPRLSWQAFYVRGSRWRV